MLKEGNKKIKPSTERGKKMKERLEQIERLLWMYEMKDFQMREDKQEIEILTKEKKEILEKLS